MSLRTRLRPALPYLGAVAIVAAASLLSDLQYRITHSSRISSVFIGGVLLASFLFGSRPGYLAAVLSSVVFLWLVDPRYSFAFGSPDDFDTVTVLLAVSLLTGALVGRIRDQAAREKARARATDTLLVAAQAFSATTDEGEIRAGLCARLADEAGASAFVHAGEALHLRAIGEPEADVAALAAEIEVQARTWPGPTVATPNWRFRVLGVGGETFGVVGWRRGAEGSDQDAMLAILVDTAAAAIARTRLSAAKAEAESRARTEDLRNALLSSISHDARTPLAAIMASATSLQEFGDALDAATRKDLAATIHEETVRLDAFVANLLNMSRLEAGALKIHATPFSVAEVIARTLERRAPVAGGAVALAIAPGLPDALGDAGLFAQAVGNVLENALRYADPLSIEVRASSDAAEVCVEVRDHGPGVPPEELPQLFDKFYRGPSANGAPGTGLGLSITKGLVEAMGGRVGARNRGGRGGLSVTLALPVSR